MSNETIPVRHYQVQDRYAFGRELLELALSKLPQSYQIHSPDQQIMNEKRGEIQIMAGKLDLEWMSTTWSREQELIPIRIPIYRGLLGLRLILAKKENARELGKLRSLEDLRKFVGGHGRHWGDLPVYAANGLRVETNARYNTLFTQLIGGRFDYFHRGLNEIWAERARHADNLVIVDNVMLFYPHPVYFFVGKHRPELAQHLEKGLKMAIEDGSYKELFLDHFGAFIQQGHLNDRHLIILKNPVVPKASLNLDTSWWLPKRHQARLKTQ